LTKIIYIIPLNVIHPIISLIFMFDLTNSLVNISQYDTPSNTLQKAFYFMFECIGTSNHFSFIYFMIYFGQMGQI
jgi:hypothetical protein